MNYVQILMPALSPTMEEGKLARWLVKKGDRVSAGDVIAEIETDKATMEVEAVDGGILDDILVPEGAEGVKVNTPIARLAGDGAGSASEPHRSNTKSDPTMLVTGSLHDGGMRRPVEALADRVPAAATLEKAIPPDATPSPPPEGGHPPRAVSFPEQVRATPLARRLAELRELDLAAIKGSGPHGRVVKADIERSAPGARAKVGDADLATISLAVTAQGGPPLEELGIAPGSYDLVPLDGMRKTIARRMTESFRDVPHFPLTIDLEIDQLLAARAHVNAVLEPTGVKVSLNDMVIKAAASALKRVPEANASYSPDGIAMHHHADIAVAVAIPGGLITPIIRRADAKGLAQIAREAKDLAERARSKKLAPEEYQGGTFSVSNLGMFDIKSFASILNGPQGCILSVGAGSRRPIVRGDEIAIATVMTVTLTCDHRVVDGAIGAQWLQAFKAVVADPLLLLV